jgi:hypothetical protein
VPNLIMTFTHDAPMILRITLPLEDQHPKIASPRKQSDNSGEDGLSRMTLCYAKR